MRLNGKAIVGVALSVVLLWWTLRDVSMSHLVHELRQADPWLFLLAVVVATLGLVPRAVRWGILQRPVSPDIPFRPRFAATSIGFAANNLLPARVGEFARAFSLSRLARVPTPAAFGSLVIERVLDGIVVVGLLFGAIAMPGFPARGLTGINVQAAAVAALAFVACIGVVLFLLVIAPARSAQLVERFAGRFLPRSFRRPVVDAMVSFIDGIAALRDPRLFLLSAVWALAQWVFLALSFWFGFLAFGIHEAGLVGAFFLQSLIALAVAVPSSPGFFGPWEAAAKIGLGLWGVAPEKAVSFAVGFHIGGFIPVTAIGIYYVWKMGLSWKDVGRSEEVVEARIERAHGMTDGSGREIDAGSTDRDPDSRTGGGPTKEEARRA